MHLVFDIFQGIGIAAAVGIRPFLPVLAVGALATAGAEIHFNGTDYSFLQAPVFLLAVALAAIALALLERWRKQRVGERRAVAAGIAVAALVLAALVFAGSLSRGHYAAWPGYIGGVACAAVATVATRPLFARVARRLGNDGSGTLPVYAEGLAVALAILSVLAPPVGPLALAVLLWLLVASRKRGEEKYAGLRILR
ncbi:MAG: DUF4126 family protein [Actinomycetota bacterium]|nr:DUF4126 family protein [Actinomycetota bacterium]